MSMRMSGTWKHWSWVTSLYISLSITWYDHVIWSGSMCSSRETSHRVHGPSRLYMRWWICPMPRESRSGSIFRVHIHLLSFSVLSHHPIHSLCTVWPFFVFDDRECHCPEKSASGAWYPACEYPLVKDPITCDCAVKTTTLPPVGPITFDCPGTVCPLIRCRLRPIRYTRSCHDNHIPYALCHVHVWW